MEYNLSALKILYYSCKQIVLFATILHNIKQNVIVHLTVVLGAIVVYVKALRTLIQLSTFALLVLKQKQFYRPFPLRYPLKVTLTFS